MTDAPRLPLFFDVFPRTPAKLCLSFPREKSMDSLSGYPPRKLTGRLTGQGLKSWPSSVGSFEGVIAFRKDTTEKLVAAGAPRSLFHPFDCRRFESRHLVTVEYPGYTWIFVRPGMDILEDNSLWGPYLPRQIPATDTWNGDSFFGTRNTKSVQIFCTRQMLRVLIKAGITSKEMRASPMDLRTSVRDLKNTPWMPDGRCGAFDEALPKKMGGHRKPPQLYPAGYPVDEANLGPPCDEDFELGLIAPADSL